MFLNATPTERLPWNFQRLLQARVCIKCVYQNFHIGDLRSGQFCDLPIISQWEKNERHLFWMKTFETHKHRFSDILDTLRRNIATTDSLSCRQGHFRSWKFTSSFSAISFDIDQLERWKYHRCVQADVTDRLVCSMTFSDQVMTLTLGKSFFLNHPLRPNYSSFNVSPPVPSSYHPPTLT